MLHFDLVIGPPEEPPPLESPSEEPPPDEPSSEVSFGSIDPPSVVSSIMTGIYVSLI